jgi:hypothetical protein
VAGDIAVPFSARPAPAYKTAKITDRFAPASGKPSAVVVTAKEFDQALGEGKIVYLNIGSNRGAAVGSYLRVFRTYRDMDNDVFQQATSYYLPELTTLNAVPSMKRSERAQLPRSVLGEVMLLSVEDESATGIVTFSREEIFVGDEVEME